MDLQESQMELGGNGVQNPKCKAQILRIESPICFDWFMFAIEV
jgi:hypothetical protein